MTATTAATEDTLLCSLLEMHTSLYGYVRASFPRLCSSHVDDAVSSVYVALVEQREKFAAAHAISEKRLAGLCRVIAWRHARGIVRRRSYSHELSGQELLIERWSAQPRQLDRLLIADIEEAIPEVAAAINARHADQLAAALRHRMFTGEPETVIAKAFGVRREYLNRARRQLCEVMA